VVPESPEEPLDPLVVPVLVELELWQLPKMSRDPAHSVDEESSVEVSVEDEVELPEDEVSSRQFPKMSWLVQPEDVLLDELSSVELDDEVSSSVHYPKML